LKKSREIIVLIIENFYRNIEMTTNSGTYLLLIRLKKDTKLTIGKLGTFYFLRGYYIYSGSALKNLAKRVERHKKKKGKKIFWHIDYLLDCRDSEIQETVTFSRDTYNECGIIKRLISFREAQVLVKGFGASDCREKCPGHLVFFKNCPSLTIL